MEKRWVGIRLCTAECLADHVERRAVPQPRARVCSRDGLPSVKALFETQAGHAHAPGQTVHVPGKLIPPHRFQQANEQLLRSLAYIHSVGICHRDIKPQNLLLNPATGILMLCDFGSAKILVQGEPNVSYICSRYYRAPELIFGATNYTTNIGGFTYSLIVYLRIC